MEFDTKSPEFNKQVIDVYRTMDATWTAGTIHGKAVDTVDLWGIDIKKGRMLPN
jgi:hypothetical protein